MPVLSLRTRYLCRAAYLYGSVLKFSVPALVIVTAFLFDLTRGTWALVVLGLVAWWFIAAPLVSNAITWTLAYGLGITREMRKVGRLEYRMKQMFLDQFNAPPATSRQDRRQRRNQDYEERYQYIDGLTNRLERIVSCLERIETELRPASPTPGAATPTTISGEEVITPAACECGHVCRYAAENGLDPELASLRASCCICDNRHWPCSVCAPRDTPEAKQERERRYEKALEIVRPILEPVLREMLRDKPPEPKGK